MRIIKEDYNPEVAKKVHPVRFNIFPEEWISSPPSLERSETEDKHEGGNGKDHEPIQPQIDLIAVKKEADQIIERGRQEAEQLTAQAGLEAQQIAAQANDQANQMLAQAAADGEAHKKEAYAAGFSGGEETGFKKGYEDGYLKGKSAALDEAQRSLAMINRATHELENHRAQILHEAQQDIVKMAIAVAEKVLHKEIMTDPNTIISVVKNAVSKVGFKRNFTISVNPLDIEVLQSGGREISALIDNLESIKFKPDPKVEAGGCIVQTESGVVDAQVDRQFNEIKNSVLNAMEGKAE